MADEYYDGLIVHGKSSLGVIQKYILQFSWTSNARKFVVIQWLCLYVLDSKKLYGCDKLLKIHFFGTHLDFFQENLKLSAIITVSISRWISCCNLQWKRSTKVIGFLECWLTIISPIRQIFQTQNRKLKLFSITF